MKLISVLIVVIVLIFSVGCIQSNEFIPVIPTEKFYGVPTGTCYVVLNGTAYRADRVCEKVILNQINWVKFCPEDLRFPICEVRP